MSALSKYRITKTAHGGERWPEPVPAADIAVFRVFYGYSFVYAVVNSFKPIDELFAYPPRFFVKRPTSANYFLLFKLVTNMWVPFSRYLLNSLLVSGLGTVFSVLISSMAAYSLALYRLKVRWLFDVVVLALLFSGSVLSYPQYLIMVNIGMINNYLSYLLPGCASAMGLFLMKQFMGQIPFSLVESARIDGASQTRVFFSIVMPQVRPAWLTLSLFSFQGLWNQSANSMIFNEELKLVNTAIQQVMNGGMARYGVAMAGAVVLIVPPVVFFLVTQSGVIQTMSHSGIK